MRVAVVAVVVAGGAGGTVGSVGAASAGGWNRSFRGAGDRSHFTIFCSILGRCVSCFAASSVFPSRSTVPLLVTLVGLGTSTGQAAESVVGVQLERVFDVELIVVELRADNL